MRDKTRSVKDSVVMVCEVVAAMQHELGYSEQEAWEKVSDELLYRLEEHDFDPPTLEDAMWVSSAMLEIFGGKDGH